MYGPREYVGRETRSMLIDRATIDGDFVAAAGDRLNQKIDFDRIEEGTLEWFLCIEGLKLCVHTNFGPSHAIPVRTKIDAILTVGSGATELGDPLAQEIGARHIPVRKDGNKNFYIDGDADGIETGVIVDDVYRTGHNGRIVEGLASERGINTIGFVAVFNRSPNPAPELKPGIPVHSVIYKNMER